MSENIFESADSIKGVYPTTGGNIEALQDGNFDVRTSKELHALSNPKHAEQLWKDLKMSVTDYLYKNDRLVRESMDAASAVRNDRNIYPDHGSKIVYDEHGRVIAAKEGVLASERDQIELMRALRRDMAQTSQGQE